MGIRGVTPGRGPEPRGPERKKEISRELKENVDDTKAVATRTQITRFQAKIDGYAKGPANKSEDRKISSLAKKLLS